MVLAIAAGVCGRATMLSSHTILRRETTRNYLDTNPPSATFCKPKTSGGTARIPPPAPVSARTTRTTMPSPSAINIAAAPSIRGAGGVPWTRAQALGQFEQHHAGQHGRTENERFGTAAGKRR